MSLSVTRDLPVANALRSHAMRCIQPCTQLREVKMGPDGLKQRTSRNVILRWSIRRQIKVAPINHQNSNNFKDLGSKTSISAVANERHCTFCTTYMKGFGSRIENLKLASLIENRTYEDPLNQ